MTSTADIVALLCVMMMNCESAENFLMIRLNFSMFASSNGASTSSKIQNGAGLSGYIANYKAVAIKVFSSPDTCAMLCRHLPLGWIKKGSLHQSEDFLYLSNRSLRLNAVRTIYGWFANRFRLEC